MNILVINGSPKGENSITLQTVRYLEMLHPEHTWEVLHAGVRIHALEKDFSPAVEAFGRAELVLFSYPVYTFLAPSQLHRFIELMKLNDMPKGLIATQLTTSKHFYDVTAHAYIEDNCHDMGFKVIRGLSADMEDLLSEKGRKEAEDFLRFVLFSVEKGIFEPAPVRREPFAPAPVSVPEKENVEKPGDTVIVADAGGSPSLQSMIERFRAVYPRKTRVIDIGGFPFKGGCLSCFRCAADGKCVYSDGFDAFLREKIQCAEAIVIAFEIKDHSMGARFKMYDDRQFCNGHRTVTMGRPFAYLVSGPLSGEKDLETVIRARAEVGGNYLAGIACDERETDRSVDETAAKLDYAVRTGLRQPANFYGVGGMKIFRDLIWQMQGLMKADHRFFKSHGQYDFPQKRRGDMLKMYLVGALMTNPKLMAKAGGKVSEGMLMPYKKVLDACREKK